MNRLLVTGSGGFVGRHVVDAVDRAGAEVVVVDHQWVGSEELERQVGEGPIDSCIHLGWYAAPADYLVSADGNMRSLWDSITLVDLLITRGCRHLVVAGTSAEYAPQSRPITEDDPVRPWSVYGAAKAALSTLLDSSWPPAGMGVAWARLFNVTGPGEDPARLLPTVARSLVRRDPVDLSSGRQVRDFLDVRDVAAALVGLSTSGARGRFNVSSGCGVALKDLITGLGAALDGVGLLRFGAVSHAEHDAPFVVGDNARLRKATGWVPQVRTDEMLQRVADYWQHESDLKEPHERRRKPPRQ